MPLQSMSLPGDWFAVEPMDEDGGWNFWADGSDRSDGPPDDSMQDLEENHNPVVPHASPGPAINVTIFATVLDTLLITSYNRPHSKPT